MSIEIDCLRLDMVITEKLEAAVTMPDIIRIDMSMSEPCCDFKILSSGSVGQSFKNKSGNDIGLGEVYWNIGQAEPCVGNPSQVNNYAPVCKEGSSHRRYVNKPEKYFCLNT